MVEETRRRLQRMGRDIHVCLVRKKALNRGSKHAHSLTLVEKIKAGREREKREWELYVESLREHLSAHDVAVVLERRKHDEESFAPRKRPRTRRRWPASSPRRWSLDDQ
jgi:hypothetical protein